MLSDTPRLDQCLKKKKQRWRTLFICSLKYELFGTERQKPAFDRCISSAGHNPSLFPESQSPSRHFPRKHSSNFPAHGSLWKWVINIIIVFVSERHRRLAVNGAAWPPPAQTLCVCSHMRHNKISILHLKMTCAYRNRPWHTHIHTHTHTSSKVMIVSLDIRFK